jgi:hypothetical protein
MKKLALVLLLALPLAACGEESAVNAIEANGFTNVRLGGTPWYGCSDSDSAFYNTLFTATAPNGKTVTGVACGGALKGWTVRIR